VAVSRHRINQTAEKQAARRPRLLAVGPVTIDAQWRLRAETEQFYAVLIGLGWPQVVVEPSGWGLLAFDLDGPDLRVRLTRRPRIWANRPRVVIEIPDLHGLCCRLRAEDVPYQFMHGWCWTDQRIGLWDPSGNRLEVKRLW